MPKVLVQGCSLSLSLFLFRCCTRTPCSVCLWEGLLPKCLSLNTACFWRLWSQNSNQWHWSPGEHSQRRQSIWETVWTKTQWGFIKALSHALTKHRRNYSNKNRRACQHQKQNVWQHGVVGHWLATCRRKVAALADKSWCRWRWKKWWDCLTWSQAPNDALPKVTLLPLRPRWQILNCLIVPFEVCMDNR